MVVNFWTTEIIKIITFWNTFGDNDWCYPEKSAFTFISLLTDGQKVSVWGHSAAYT